MHSRNRSLRVGLVVDGSDHFIRPAEQVLRDRYRVSRFAPRFIKAPVIGASVNKVLLELQLRAFLTVHDLVFFEWAGDLLVKATHMVKRCPLVTRLHSIEVATAAHRVEWSQVDSAIVVSEQMGRRLLKAAPSQPGELRVINYGVNLELFRPTHRQFGHRIGMIARVVPIKRVYEAVLTVYDLRRQGYPFALTVGGPLNDSLEPRYPRAIYELIDRLELEEHVVLLGPVPDPTDFYGDIDIFLSNSFWEGQQNALLEAMASGCYCLSHCWGGAEEVVPAENIFVTDADLQSKLLEYAARPDDEKRHAQAAMRNIAEERFDERRMIREILGVIEQAMNA